MKPQKKKFINFYTFDSNSVPGMFLPTTPPKTDVRHQTSGARFHNWEGSKSRTEKDGKTSTLLNSFSKLKSQTNENQ